MIRLTNDQGKHVYINPETITIINTDSQGVTGIKTVDGYTKAAESPEEVARKVLEWRLEMERYKAAAIVALTHRANENNPYTPPLDAQRELEILAGLEESEREF